MRYKFVLASRNSKTGTIPVVYSGAESCPASCPLRGAGCYAEQGRTLLQWRRVNLALADLAALIARLPRYQIWRYGVAGDLPGTGDAIDGAAFRALTRASAHTRGFAYTHKPVTRAAARNRLLIRSHNARVIRAGRGLLINLSADSLADADDLVALGIAPVVVTVPSDYPKHATRTPAGRPIVTCPATYAPGVTCATCQLCAKPRRSIVAFPAHGTRVRLVDRRLKGEA